MLLKTSDVSIRCMGCSELMTLEEAVRAGWKMCKSCNFSICELCYHDLGFEKKCLSFDCMSKHRTIELIPLPVDKIIIFAQKNYQSDYKKGLLYNLFYKEKEKIHAPPFFVVMEKEEPQLDNDMSTIQEEIWKNFQLVITKRKGGKFITWERVL